MNQITPHLFKKYPTVQDLAAADLKEVEKIIHSAGFYHSKALSLIESSNRICEVFGGEVPQNMDDFDSEVVFCGFGEPTYNLDVLDEVASYLHCTDKTTRINTNGQGNLIHKRDITDVIVTSCDVINVSLNESTAEKYQKHCKSIFGTSAFSALLEFAKLCKQRGGNVVFSVVDSIGEKDVAECQKLANSLSIPLRVRAKE